MEIFELLRANKGTVSSALGKELGAKVLNGDLSILQEALKFVVFDLDNAESKGIRAGAAKIIEIVAEKKPELIARDLCKLKPALNAPEPQTRWMLMYTFGYCAKLNPKESISVIDFAKKYLTENAGVCLSGAVHQYLGRIGATSEKTAMLVLPLLDDSLKTASENEIDWILEGFLSIINQLKSDTLLIVKRNAENYLDSRKISTQDRAKKILKKINAVHITNRIIS
jgi:hypothetical protein